MTQEMKKVLNVNAAMVDMTKTVEETLAAYKSVNINAAVVLISEEVQKFIHKYALKMNVAGMLSLPGGCKVNLSNGNIEIGPESGVTEPTVLIANGNMIIHPGSQAAIASFAKIVINGNVLAPESMRGALTGAMVNGNATYYPDDFTLINGDLIVDGRFIRRAKQNESYFVTGTVTITAPNLDIQPLLEKDVYFETGRAFLSEPYAAAADLFSGKTKLHTIPNGFDIVEGNTTVDESLTLRFGKKLYVMGNLMVPYDAAAFSGRFENIVVLGGVTLPESAKSDWLKVISKFESISVYKGMLLGDQGQLQVTAELLDEYAMGVTIHDCGSLDIDPAIPVDMLREKLHKIEDCGSVTCGKEQLGLIQSRSEDCGFVGIKKEEEPEAEDDLDVVKVNAAMYTL